MESLLRTRVDRFQVKDSLKLDEIEVLRDEGKVGEYICSLEEALEGYLPVYTTAEGDKALKNGNPCFKQQLDLEKSTSLEERKSGDRYRMYNRGSLWVYMNTRKKNTGGNHGKCSCRMEKETDEIYSRYSGFSAGRAHCGNSWKI